MIQNARVMMEMAEFDARQNADVEIEVIEALRSDAAQIRLGVLMVLAQCALQQANESVRMRAFRAASVYTGMAARMTELVETHASSALPQFVAAM